MTDGFCRLDGKVAVVTGGSRGIGAAVSRELVAAGARVAINYRAGAPAADTLAREIDGISVQADVADDGAVAALVARVEEELGPIDILVNNAGITRDTLIVRMSDEEWDEVIQTNLRGMFNACRRRRQGDAEAPERRHRDVTSVVGLHGNAGQTNYAASKGGIIGFTLVARQGTGKPRRSSERDRARIHLDGADRGLPDELKQLILGSTPLGRLGEPEDVAGVYASCAQRRRDS